MSGWRWGRETNNACHQYCQYTERGTNNDCIYIWCGIIIIQVHVPYIIQCHVDADIHVLQVYMYVILHGAICVLYTVFSLYSNVRDLVFTRVYMYIHVR